ncbi:DNA polymerase delta subunit 2 [Hypsibius exemplaris]|uniref:DNA polymerase delta subunit 2 n=1 Tax=Hypsibius exemplaris TaxID=2072580 RepID=A0A1W0X9K5_HYPEX|nr:DNA polymerase delta subunit 2 [Hypsibius exemplaris]
MVSETAQAFSRVHSDFQNTSDRFVFTAVRNSFPQYAQLYFTRLEIMRGRVREQALQKWGRDIPIRTLSELTKDEPCIIIGTAYKEMELKPSVLKDLSENLDIATQPILPRYAGDHDTLLLEEETQRIVLVGNIDMREIVTGVTVAIMGTENEDGEFVVKDHCFAGMPPQPEYPTINTDCYVAFLSGLNLGGDVSSLATLDLCIESLTGQFGTAVQQRKMSKVTALVLAGNHIAPVKRDTDVSDQKTRYLTRHSSAGSIDGMQALDGVLMQLVACMNVFLMPGANDPGNYMLPQQSLHPCMLPLSNKSTGLRLVTNPFEAEFNGVKFLGTSGQNIGDIYKNCHIDEPLTAMEKTLTWTHIAPTAPDTLACYPFTDVDPFILEATPHVYFAGNQGAAGYRLVKGPTGQTVLLLSVPDFSKVPTLMLVNLKNLEVERITFKDAI